MSRPFIFAMLTVAAAVLVLSTTPSASGLITVTPYEADVNRSGHVNIADVQQVANQLGRPVPAATPGPLVVVGHRFPEVVVQPGSPLTRLGEVDQALCSSPVFHLEARAEEEAGVTVYVGGNNYVYAVGGAERARLPARRWMKLIMGTDVFGRQQEFGSQNWSAATVDVLSTARTTFRLEALCPTT